MGAVSNIEWTEATWNPVTGCTKISPGCKHCYAERLAHRLQAMGSSHYVHGFTPTLQPSVLLAPLRWRRPRFIFVNSMSDLFHESVPTEYIRDVFAVMAKASWHTFQVLTKRADRLDAFDAQIDWPENVWMGVSVESEAYLSRVIQLRGCGAAIKFLSLEPLLGPLPSLDLAQIDWVIVGGESGPGARPILEEWVINIRDNCHAHGVPFFFKQWGGVNKKRSGRVLDGKTWDAMPNLLTLRQMTVSSSSD